MNILAFDTSTAVLSVAAQTSNGDRSSSIVDMGLRHGELLAPEINRILETLSIKIADLDLIICTRGPGSFTGLRIGMATAKGISSGAGIPMISVNLPDVLFQPYSFYDGPVIPVIDAKKNRFYGGTFINGALSGEYFDLDAETVITNFVKDKPALITGPDADLFKSRLPNPGANYFAASPPVLIYNLIAIGIKKFNTRGADAPGQGPLYIRKSDAELSLESRHGTG